MLYFSSDTKNFPFNGRSRFLRGQTHRFQGLGGEQQTAMEKDTLLIITGPAVHMGDGYKARIDMELPFLCDIYQVSLLAPQGAKELRFSEAIDVYYYGSPGAVNDFLSLRETLKRLMLRLNNPILYGEALSPSFKAILALPLRKLTLVFDCHGTEPNEWKLYHPGLKGRLLSFCLRCAEHCVLHRAGAIVTVTNRQYTLRKTNKPHTVFPMLPSPHFFDGRNYRSEIRKQLNIDDSAAVFVYSGQAQKWQMCEETIKYYKRIEDTHPDAFLLVLTRDVAVFKTLVKENGIARFAILTADYHDMPKYLDACDFGFCLRNASIINQVASPH